MNTLSNILTTLSYWMMLGICIGCIIDKNKYPWLWCWILCSNMFQASL